MPRDAFPRYLLVEATRSRLTVARGAADRSTPRSCRRSRRATPSAASSRFHQILSLLATKTQSPAIAGPRPPLQPVVAIPEMSDSLFASAMTRWNSPSEFAVGCDGRAYGPTWHEFIATTQVGANGHNTWHPGGRTSQVAERTGGPCERSCRRSPLPMRGARSTLTMDLPLQASATPPGPSGTLGSPSQTKRSSGRTIPLERVSSSRGPRADVAGPRLRPRRTSPAAKS